MLGQNDMITLHKKWINYTQISKLKIDKKRSPFGNETSLMSRRGVGCVWIAALIIWNSLFLVPNGPQIKTKTAHDFGNSILKKIN